MQNTQVTKINEKISRFSELVFGGMEMWMEAGKLVCEMLEENPDAIDLITEKCPNISPELVIRFEQIGRKQIHPQLLLSDAPGVQKLRKLPYQLQERFLVEPIEMLAKTENGWETLRVDIRNLSPRQAEQVFGKEGIRTAAAQRVFIEDRAAKSVAPMTTANLPYRIVGRKLVVVEPCTFTAREMAQMLAEIEGR